LIQRSLAGAGLAALLAAAALANETGSTRVDAPLMAAPYRDAKQAGDLTANTRVEVRERRGAWIRVAAADKDGWLRLHQVRLGEGEAKQGSSGFFALWNLGTTGRSGTQGIVATTGIRGMSADQLKDAKPNPEQEQKLNQYRASDEQARQLAAAGDLKEKAVAALPVSQ
jgi:hypothetical protein